MSHLQTLRKIVLPQAFRRMIPPFVNESVSILKFSSLVSVLGVADLTYQAQVLSTASVPPDRDLLVHRRGGTSCSARRSYFARRLELRLSVSD